MRKHSIQGVWRGKGKRTIVCDPELQRAADLVNRQFTATRPNQLWVADFTYVTTHQGFVYTAFIIDVFALRIVGWKVANNMNTDLVMDALEQALYARNKPKHVIHHSDRGSQYLSIRYTERLRDAHITASVGTTGDSYDNALAETVNGLYKTEVIHHQKPWKRMIDVELATLNWVDWFNHRRLLSSIGYVPPAEFETAYYRQLEESAKVAWLKINCLRNTRGGSVSLSCTVELQSWLALRHFKVRFLRRSFCGEALNQIDEHCKIPNFAIEA